MKKLLHERLRDADGGCDRTAKAVGRFSCYDIDDCKSCYDLLREAIADEIERQYVPVPRFEDGETVREGSETRHGTVEYISVEASRGGWGNYALHMDDGNCIGGTFSQRVERPAPEALGADGLPIVEGETVYDIESGDKRTVKIPYAGTGKTFFCEGDYCDPAYLTHTRPDTQKRIDADALKESEEYWDCISASCKDCPAKIDGEKPWQRYGVLSCVTSQRLDLLRRQRELDARKGGAE